MAKSKTQNNPKEETYYQSIKRRDPAARNNFQIFMLYPGVRALRWYRVAHFFYVKCKLKFIGECFSLMARNLTGIEIHPAAFIGKNVFIDHGIGVVIGETTIVEENVTLFQGVVLGGRTSSKGLRHPHIKKNVIIGSHAQVLGHITVGEGAVVGAGAIVLTDVQPETKIHAGEIHRN